MDRLSGGFDMDTGETWVVINLEQPRSYNFETKEKGDFGQLYARNPKLERTQKLQSADPDNYLINDYEMHLRTKIDYLFRSELPITPSDRNKIIAKPV